MRKIIVPTPLLSIKYNGRIIPNGKIYNITTTNTQGRRIPHRTQQVAPVAAVTPASIVGGGHGGERWGMPPALCGELQRQ